VCAVDDRQREVCLAQPATRIAALSPGATELVFAAGAGDQVVAVVSFSDFPPEARQIASVGSHDRMDIERLVTLRPDLIIGWVTGNPAGQVEVLESLGFPVFYLEPHSFEDISSAIERLAVLAGTAQLGSEVAEEFRQGMRELREQYADAEPITVFYQVWDEPLMTVNDTHFIGQVISLCGGVNVYGQQARQVPRIDMESILSVDPEAIVTAGMGEDNREWLENWTSYHGLQAVEKNNLFFVPPSLLQRPTPRLLQGSRILCEKLDKARARR
jgi:iron complex transport system substrate-binding protein